MFWSRKRRALRRETKVSPRLVLIKQILIGFGLLLFVALVVTGVWYGSRLKTLNISEVSVTGGVTISHQEIQKLAEDLLIGSYFKLIPKTFSFTYPKEQIATVIASVPRVKEVKLEVKSGEKLNISFTEYEPIALWCKPNDFASCVFIESSGYAFGEAPKLTGSAFLRYVDAGREPQVGEVSFDTDFIEDSTTFIDAASAQFNFKVMSVEKVSGDEVFYYLVGGSVIKTSRRMNVADTLENLNTILTSDQFKHLAPGNFQYVDLRYGNKVFVNEEMGPGENDEEVELGTESDTQVATSTEAHE